MNRRAWRLVLPLAWMAILWMVSSLPGTAQPHAGGFVIPEWLQDTLHVPAYAILCGAWLWAFSPGRPFVTAAVSAFCATTAYGVMDEVHQAFVPGRTASAGDVLLDAAGAAIVLACAAWVRGASRERPQQGPQRRMTTRNHA